MMDIAQLRPQNVWAIFKEICGIPRPSGKEEAIGRWIVEQAKSRGLEVEQDAAGNVLIRKPGSPGLENEPRVMLQDHMDMVPQKDEGVEHDFETDPIRPRIDGKWVRASGTTLGADNGIGLSMALAVAFDPDAKHPPLSVLVTTEEETGMAGANAVAPEWLDAPFMLNLDSGPQGVALVGCAGGRYCKAAFDLMFSPVPEGLKTYEIEVGGLCGGHSGSEINDGLANSILVLGEALRRLQSLAKKEGGSLRLVDLQGGSALNAIPRSAKAVVVGDGARWQEELARFAAKRAESCIERDKGLSIALREEPARGLAASAEATEKCLAFLGDLPNGVARMSQVFDGVVEASSSLGVAKVKDNAFVAQCFARSLSENGKRIVCEQIKQAVTDYSGRYEESDDYPGWDPAADSALTDRFCERYEAMFGQKPKVEVVHAGLECGLLLGRAKTKFDALSIGPTILGEHSPRERVEIETVEQCHRLLLDLLANMPAPRAAA